MAWMVDAACVDAPGLPWTADAWTVSQAAQASMHRVCGSCPVRAVCDAYAVPTTVVAGFWAGPHRGPLDDPDQPVQLPLFDDLPIAG
jgi:hypothetical protein